jgi:hypothetical protein
MKQVTSKKIKMLTLFGRMWMLGSRLMFSARRKLQIFEPGYSSESLSSGEVGLVIVICYISAMAKDDCLLHGLWVVQPLRFYP